jgi:hypothetical protein
MEITPLPSTSPQLYGGTVSAPDVTTVMVNIVSSIADRTNTDISRFFM